MNSSSRAKNKENSLASTNTGNTNIAANLTKNSNNNTKLNRPFSGDISKKEVKQAP